VKRAVKKSAKRTGVKRAAVKKAAADGASLDEMKKAHRKFIRDYNCQIHFAHRERQDGRHSPRMCYEAC